MLSDILKKFQSLAPEKRKYFSHPEILAKVKNLEKKYQEPLSLLVMELACQPNLTKEAIKQIIIKKGQGEALAQELWEAIFSPFYSAKQQEEINNNKNDSENLLEKKEKQKIVFSSSVKEPEINSHSLNSVSEKEDSALGKNDIQTDDSDLLSEEENKELQKIVLNSKEGYSFALNWIKEAEKIFDSLQLSCSEDQRQKIIALLVSALRGARNTIALRETLSRSEFLAGLKLSLDDIQKIVFAVKKAKNDLEKKSYDFAPPQAVLDDPFAHAKKKENFSSKGKEESAKEEQLLPPPLPTKFSWKKLLPLKIISVKKKQPPAISKEVFSNDKEKQKENIVASKEKQEKKNDSFIEEKNEKKDKLPEKKPNKLSLKEKEKNLFFSSKEERKLIGPLDEIEQLSLADFRQWSSDPYRSAQHIKEKINNLYEESFSRGLEALQRWRRSPLYQLYLQAVQEALIKKKPVDKILSEKEQERKETLTKKEFEALADLNKELRF